MGCGNSTIPGSEPTTGPAPGSRKKSVRGAALFTKPFLDRYTPGINIGSGGYSQVHLVKAVYDKSDWVVKIVTKTTASSTPNDGTMSMGAIALELQALKKVQGHEGVVKYREFIDSKDRCFMVFENLRGPDLFDQIEQGAHYTEQMAADSICELVDAMAHVHARKIIHRDIKPENIVLRTPTGPPVLIDFGLAIPNKGSFTGRHLGTPNFMAPEMIKEMKCCEKIDVWGMGVIVYTMLTGDLAFKEAANRKKGDFSELYGIICQGTPSFSDSCWDVIGKSAKDLIESMFTLDPAERPSFEQLKEHPWLRSTCTKYIAQREDPVMLASHKIIKTLNLWRKKNWKQKSLAALACVRMSSLAKSTTLQTSMESVTAGARATKEIPKLITELPKSPKESLTTIAKESPKESPKGSPRESPE